MKAVIFIPGYKGSFLKSTGSTSPIWITAYETILGKTSLAFDITQTNITDPNLLNDSGILDRINIIPLFFSKDIYHSFISNLYSSNKRNDFIPFSYDWRKEVMEHVYKLDQQINLLIEKGYTQINIIAHSLGGLITAYYLRYGIQEPQKAIENWSGSKFVNKVVFASVPFRGTLVALRDVQFGENVIFNKQILNKNAIRSFPVAYHLLPDSDTKALFSINDDFKSVSLYDLSTWKNYQLGLFEYPQSQDNSLHFLSKYLSKGKKIFQLINTATNHPPKSLQVLNIRGKSKKTYKHFFLYKKNNATELIINSKRLKQIIGSNGTIYAEGDGTVLLESTLLPNAFKSSSNDLIVNTSHIEIFKNRLAQNSIIDFINS